MFRQVTDKIALGTGFAAHPLGIGSKGASEDEAVDALLQAREPHVSPQCEISMPLERC